MRPVLHSVRFWKQWLAALSVLTVSVGQGQTELVAEQPSTPVVVPVESTQKVEPAAGSASQPAPQRAAPSVVDAELEPLVLAALSDNAVRADEATQALRKAGPRGLKYVFDRAGGVDYVKWMRLADAVAAQRDSQFSRLFWHTDLAEAQAVARRENKPILSLRLLGRLTDELSCANSRFFRTTLYPHRAVQSLLSERFVLHWQSVRDVPVITIDLGDGRSIRRTITGNSLHLVLDANGRTIDVLPGLYGAGFFARVLQQSEPLARQARDLDDAQLGVELARFHQQQLDAQQARWAEDWKQLNAQTVTARLATAPLQAAASLLEPAPRLDEELDDAVWERLAPRYFPEVQFDGMARMAVGAKAPADVAGLRAITKSISELPTMKLVRNLVPVIARDSVMNEYKFHRRIHQWLAAGERHSPEELTADIYDVLFLSPLDDPWYGLSQPDVYSAIENDGRHDAVAATPNTGD